MLLLLEILKVQLLRVMKRRSSNQGVRPSTCQVRRDSLWGWQPSRANRWSLLLSYQSFQRTWLYAISRA